MIAEETLPAYPFDNDVPSDQVVPLKRLEELKACVDFACRSERGDLVLLGWVFDPHDMFDGFTLLREKRGLFKSHGYAMSPVQSSAGGANLAWFARPDVARAMSHPETSGLRCGFLLVIPRSPADALVAVATKSGKYAQLPFVALEDHSQIREGFERHWNHLGGRLHPALGAVLDQKHLFIQIAGKLEHTQQSGESLPAVPRAISSAADPRTQFSVDAAIKIGSGVVLVGWAMFSGSDDRRINVSTQSGFKISTRLVDEHDGCVLVPTLRPDLKQTLPPKIFGDGWHGFVFYWPTHLPNTLTISVTLSASALPGGQQVALLDPDEAAIGVLARAWASAGDAIKVVADRLPNEFAFRRLVQSMEESRLGELEDTFIACDHAILLNGKLLILNGWSREPTAELARMSIEYRGATYDLRDKLARYSRPDLHDRYPWSDNEALGFVLVMRAPHQLGCDLEIAVKTLGGDSRRLQPELTVSDWSLLAQFVSSHPTVAESLLPLLSSMSGLEPADIPPARLKGLHRALFAARYPVLPPMIEQSGLLIAAVDRGYAFGQAGLLIFGWRLLPGLPPEGVKVRGEKGEVMDVTHGMFPLLRADVAGTFAAKVPGVNESCGFVCLVPLPTREGEQRALCFDFGEQGEVWLKIPTAKPTASGVALIREMIGMVPAPERMLHNLYALFDGGLGAAIEAVVLPPRPAVEEVVVHQYGPPTAGAGTSVIVPLYGRFDFVRHQLAQFADDADFDDIDLIYVVDDPKIGAATLELSAKYQPLFNVSFRVATYGRNLGFGGANNIGVALAHGEHIVLLNSDVIPQQPGWVSVLKDAIESLPDAGAVGPLLQFGDGSIQHAGMYPRSDTKLPGYLLNSHRHMGMSWSGGDEPSEHPLLTAACLMLRKQDYLDIGGFDEGYVIGDFEDSDLCLQLRKRGKTLWLVPEAKLWHLERLSQNAAEIIDQRQMITLFNGWRYTRKIRSGELPDPTQWEAAR